MCIRDSVRPCLYILRRKLSVLLRCLAAECSGCLLLWLLGIGQDAPHGGRAVSYTHLVERIDSGQTGIIVNLAGSERGVDDAKVETGWAVSYTHLKKVVEVQVDGAPAIGHEEKSRASDQPQPVSPGRDDHPVRIWVGIRISNGLHLSQKNLSYQDLVRMVEQLEGLC